MLDLLMEDSKVIQINLLEEENKKLKEENEHLRFVHKKTVEDLDATKDRLINK